MLIVKPVEDKAKQEEFCKICGAAYDIDALTYAAYEDETLLGICQFLLCTGYAMIKDLKSVPDVRDFEAMFILARGTLNFVDLCGIHFAKCEKDAGDLTLIHAVGFAENADGVLEMDLTDAFTGHCGGCKA